MGGLERRRWLWNDSSLGKKTDNNPNNTIMKKEVSVDGRLRTLRRLLYSQ
jgi:hypothetical protein